MIVIFKGRRNLIDRSLSEQYTIRICSARRQMKLMVVVLGIYFWTNLENIELCKNFRPLDFMSK
jgi:hypothetical protein